MVILFRNTVLLLSKVFQFKKNSMISSISKHNTKFSTNDSIKLSMHRQCETAVQQCMVSLSTVLHNDHMIWLCDII